VVRNWRACPAVLYQVLRSFTRTPPRKLLILQFKIKLNPFFSNHFQTVIDNWPPVWHLARLISQ